MVIKIHRYHAAAREGRVAVREYFRNLAVVRHGGALMPSAESLGGTTANANFARRSRTTTIEARPTSSSGIPIGEVAHAECVPFMSALEPLWLRLRSSLATASAPRYVTQTQMCGEERLAHDPESGTGFFETDHSRQQINADPD